MDTKRHHAVERTASLAMIALVLSLVGRNAAADPIVSRPFEPGYDCSLGLDTLGTVVAAGGDFDGDTVADFAYAAPCSPVRGLMGVGRVWIRSGATGALLRRARGREERMYFGAALAFVGDLNNDGKDEVAIGAPNFDRPAVGADPKLLDAGHLRILTAKRRQPLLQINGAHAQAELGTSVDGFADVTGDDVDDLLVSSPGQRRSLTDSTRVGGVHVLNGKTGEIVFEVLGTKAAQRFGTSVRDVGFYDGDFVHDILITSEKNPVGGVENAGGWEIRSGENPETILEQIGGAMNDRLGAGIDADGVEGSFIIGAPGRRFDDEQLLRAGAASAIHGEDGVQFSVPSVTPEQNAQFGTAVAMIGDVDGDDEIDFAASEPFLDLPFGAATVDLLPNAGRITLLSGAAGTEILSIEGSLPENWLGRSLAGGIDLNADTIPDIVAGNPGGAPLGRRGAGTVIVFSGANGNVLRTYRGVRGIETRVYTASRSGGSVSVQGFATDGRPAGVNATVLETADIVGGDLAIDVLDRAVIPPVPGGQRIVVGTGAGAGSSEVVVLSGAKRQQILAEFEAFPGELVGANVAAGDIDDDGKDEIVVSQGSSGTGAVRVRVFGQQTNDPFLTSWILRDEFLAFTAADAIGIVPIEAESANLVVTGLRPDEGREIIAAPSSGAPVVRVFSQTGLELLEWPAYDLDGSVSGVSIAAADLDGDGSKEVLTVPAEGQAIVRAFTDDGLPFTMPGAVDPVIFFALPESTISGARVSSADVDLDGRQEILITSRESGGDQVLAFEADGTAVVGYEPIDPPGGANGAAIAATDTFLKK